METVRTLALNFKSAEGKSKAVRLNNPQDQVSADQAKTAMDAIRDTDIFKDDAGDLYAASVNAEMIVKTTEEVYKAEA